MANEKIYNKRCFIKRSAKIQPDGRKLIDNYAYCSKCGKIVPQDRYNFKKHAEACSFSEHDFVQVYKENQDFACAWKEVNGKMILSVYTPRLISRPGFTERFEGGTWERVYRCAFSINQKKIQEGQGVLNNIDFWKEKNMLSLNLERPDEILNRTFHIPGIKDLSTFVDIYRGKGYYYNLLLTEEEARTLLMEDMDHTYDALWKLGDKDSYVVGDLLHVKGNPILRLKVRTSFTPEPYKMLIAQDYFFSTGKVDVKRLLKEKLWCGIMDEQLEEFDKCYPQFGLMNYWKASRHNLLIPLLAGNFDDGLELLSKSGCAVLANNLYTHKLFTKSKYKKSSNLKKWLGAPAKVLRRVQEDALLEEDFLDVIAETYREAPEYLELSDITYSLIQYLKGNVLPHLLGHRTTIEGFGNLDKKVRLRIARYLGERQGAEELWRNRRDYRIYVDYMNMCRRNENNYVCGYTPDNLDAAHTVAMNMQQVKISTPQAQRFLAQVTSKEYKSLESEYENGADYFKNNDYIIRAPRSVDEMVRESTYLRHCVRIYTEKVANGSTMIFFLREKSNPETNADPRIPFATIEVCNNTIQQLKAKCNQKAPLEAQKFVQKWASVKRLSINYRDFSVS